MLDSESTSNTLHHCDEPDRVVGIAVIDQPHLSIGIAMHKEVGLRFRDCNHRACDVLIEQLASSRLALLKLPMQVKPVTGAIED